MENCFQIDLNFSNYDISRINPKNIDASENGLEKIRSILRDIDLSNVWFSKNVRKYVIDILSKKTFDLSDPLDGSNMILNSTYTFDDFQTIFFFFGKNELIGVVASDLAAGFPLSSVILFNDKKIFHLTESFWVLGERHFQTLAEHGQHVIRERSSDPSVCLVAGDPNFAHHAWNELSALQEIVDAGFDHTTTLVAVHESLGPVNDILGSQFDVVLKLAKAQVPEVNRLGALTLCATGTFIDADLVNKVIAFADANLSPDSKQVKNEIMSRPGRSLWVSVRTRNRTLSAQVNTLASLMISYLQGRDDRMVIVDGHSLPFDNEIDAPYIQELNNSIVQDDDAVADQIILSVREKLPAAKVVKFVGKKIHESIAVGRHVGFYFCHHGTVQHKLGWFSDVKGIVHCNKETLEIHPEIWVSQQSEVAVIPNYIPIDIVEEVSQDGEMGELQIHLKHIDYKIADVPRLIEIVSGFAQDIEQSSNSSL